MGRIAYYDIANGLVNLVQSLPFNPSKVASKSGVLVATDDDSIAFYSPGSKATVKKLSDYGFSSPKVTDAFVVIDGNTVYLISDTGVVASKSMSFTPTWASVGGGLVAIVGKGKVVVCTEDFKTCNELTVDPNAPFNFVVCDEFGYCVASSGIHTQTYHGNSYDGPDYVVINPSMKIQMYLWFGWLSSKFATPMRILGVELCAFTHEQNNTSTNFDAYDIQTKKRVYGFYISSSVKNGGKTVCSDRICIGNLDYAYLVVKKNDGSFAKNKLDFSIADGYCHDVPSENKSYCLVASRSGELIYIEVDLSSGQYSKKTLSKSFSSEPPLFLPLIS